MSTSVAKMDQNKNQTTSGSNGSNVSNISNKGPKKSATIVRLLDYYFIRSGDFDIVWLNVSIFALGHLMYAYGLYLLAAEQLLTTWMYSKCSIQH